MNKISGRVGFVRALVVGLCLLISGCKLDLYTNLSEQEANQMLAVLMANGVSALKEDRGDLGIVLRIEESELAHAIDVLTANGLPQEKRDSIGKVFEKSGIMSSPFEERVRYIYALGEDISKTLSEIDGVLTARVHIVLPESTNLSDEVKPSSAAVFIKHRRGVDLDFFTPQIRRMVSNALEGVDYENVTVVLVEAEPPQILGDQIRTPISEWLFGLGVRASDERYFWNILAIFGTVTSLLVFSNFIALFAFLRTRSSLKRFGATGELQPDLEE